VSLFLLAIGCKKKDNPVDTPTSNDIPADPANVTVPATVINNVTPTATFAKSSTDASRIQMNLTGLVNPVTNQPLSLVAQQNIFVSEDGTVKGLKVTKVSTGTQLKADICFIVDNSGSMSEEADSIASGIIKFANYLQQAGLDVKFSVVGHYGYINGGINFTDATTLSSYLNRSGYTGTSRTVGFSGTDQTALETNSNSFNNSSGVNNENSVTACVFADTYYTWRSGAQRVFVAFTDEGTQPEGTQYNTAYLLTRFAGKATVHTVFSISDSHWNGSVPDTTQEWENYSAWDSYYERPWKMSVGTGGTIKFIHSNANDLDLISLPVAGALSNSYLVEYITVDANGIHTVVITIKEGTTADGKRIYTNIRY